MFECIESEYAEYAFLWVGTTPIWSITQLTHAVTQLAAESFEFHSTPHNSEFCNQLPACPEASKKPCLSISSSKNKGISDLPRAFHCQLER